jgi:hypothetical protein
MFNVDAHQTHKTVEQLEAAAESSSLQGLITRFILYFRYKRKRMDTPHDQIRCIFIATLTLDLGNQLYFTN